MNDRQPLPQPAVEENRPDSAAPAPEVLIEGLEEESRTRHDPYSALRDPNYRFFALGFLVSGFGLQMLATGLAWEVYERTQSALALGYMGLARATPVLLLALPAGHTADIFNRKRLLFITQFTFALLAAVLSLVSYKALPVWTIYLLLVLMGCARSFNGPARSSLLPLLVAPADFHNAVTWNSGVFQISATAGPIVAGAIIGLERLVRPETTSAWPVYLAAAAGCLLFAITSTLLRPRPQFQGDGRFTLSSMLAGAGHLWREKTVLASITLDLFAVLLGGATALMPVYAKDILHVGPVGLGALKSAPYIGAFLMALVLAHRPPFERSGRALLLSVAGFGACTILFGVSTSFPLSIAMLILLGALDNISVVVRQVLVQVRTPDALRGRVSAVNSVFIESSNELGAFESGAVAQWLGPVVSVVAGGVGTVLVVLGIAWLWPEVRRLGRLEEPAGGES